MRPLKQHFRRLDMPFSLRLWNGKTIRVGGPHSDQASPLFTLVWQQPESC
jgi:hypothetical protein